MSEIARKFYEWCNGKNPESDSAEAQKQAQTDGAAHNKQERQKDSDYKEAARVSSAPREKGVSGFFGRVELTEETPDGKIITHVKGVPAPPKEAPQSVKIGTTEYSDDQVIAHDLGSMAKKTVDIVKLSTVDKRFLDVEIPGSALDIRFPHRGREDEFMDYTACKYTTAAFPDLKKHIGDEPGQIDPDLVAATVRNEQHFYKNLLDTGADHFIKGHGGWPYEAHDTIGPAQLQVKNIRHLAETFPEVLGPAKTAVASAEDIHRAPFFVAAYFADVVRGVENNKKPQYISDNIWKQINEKWHQGKRTDALIIAYNPDSNQIEHVGTQLKIVKDKHHD